MTRSDSVLPLGAYESALTHRLQERINATREEAPQVRVALEPVKDGLHDRFAEAIARTLSDHLVQKLRSSRDAVQRVELINQIAALIDPDDLIDSEQILHAVYEASLGDPPAISPTSLTDTYLLTNAGYEQSMSAEIKREIRTADRVDLLCAFIKNSGISVIRDQLEYLRDNSIPLRVITSTYCGASDPQAIDRLVEEFGAEVKIGYESQETRLHAKAWLFRRESGFDTAYIGSSNLSNSALIDGIEWNVRASRVETPAILEKFEAVFDTYWNDVHFAGYSPGTDHERLRKSLKRASLGSKAGTSLELSGLRVEPYPYQETMLEALEAERTTHDRHRNLLIAATGTGKTVVAALDYRRISEQWKRKPSLLFVAHRTELLQQAMRTYREVLHDSSFGELLDGTRKPVHGKHVFATIQSLSKTLDQVGAEDFEIVVVDEFHHAEATTYQKLLDHISPKELLGLTATPERGDGVNVQKLFDYRVAYELRLWDALHVGLVAPMHYFGINDETNLTGVAWSRHKKAYDPAALGEFYIKAGESRVRLILNELKRRVFDLDAMRALGFCVSIPHANFMAEQFRKYGIPAAAITSETTAFDRRRLVDNLRNGELKILFTVDLFNEGIDIPDANTLLLLRPTESPVIFLQQLGRGLRKRPGKVCTVLDFLGMQHEEFSYEARFAALTGKRGKRLEDELTNDFPSLPGGTHIQLDRVTQERVLKNVKQLAAPTLSRLRKLAQLEQTTDLSEFLDNTQLQLGDIYRPKAGGWTNILRHEGLLTSPSPAPPHEEFLLGRLRTLLHVNDQQRAEAYLRIANPQGPPVEEFSDTDMTFARMLAAHLWVNQKGPTAPATVDEAISALRQAPSFYEELRQILSYSLARALVSPGAVEGPGAGVLFSHADYSSNELVAALWRAPLASLLPATQGGVRFLEEAAVDLFFVTLVKEDKDFSVSTRYKDFPITKDLFQWESQARTALDSKTGQRYIHHEELGSRVFLCVRNARRNSIGGAGAYTFLGDVNHVRHSGEKPIQFEWKLHRPMPARLYEQGRAVV